MGIFDDLFGAHSKATSTSTGSTTATQAETQTSQQSSTQSQKGGQAASTSGVTQTLDDKTISMLQDLLPTLTGGVGKTSGNADTVANIVNTLVKKATTGNTTDADIAAAQAKARRDYQLGTGAAIGQVKSNIGSSANSYSAALEQQGQNDLQTNLAALSSQIKTQDRNSTLAELTAAIGGAQAGSGIATSESSAPIANILAIVQGLAGAKTTTSGQSQATTFEDILNSVIAASQGNATSSGTQANTTKGTQVSSPGVIPGIVSLFK